MSLENVSRNFIMGEVTVEALRDASLEIRAGRYGDPWTQRFRQEYLLNIVGGMDRTTAGRVIYDGEDLTQVSDDDWAVSDAMRWGSFFQFYN
jgi:putative ABC transport system ATP-binding protein